MTEQKSYYAIIPANVRYDKDLPANAKLLYGEITALCNERGYCWAENKYFADLYGVSKTSISKWISALCEKGYIRSRLIYKEGSKEIDNRYLTIVNGPIEEKLNTPQRKVNGGVEEKLKDKSFNNTPNTTLNNKNNIYLSEFETLWELYPNKKGRKDAERYYIKARKNGVTFEEVKQGIENYCTQIKAKNTEKEFIKHGSTWFNQGCWTDEYDFTPKGSTTSQPAKQETELKWGGKGIL